MKLSIVIPTYNAHEWIQGCIDSIALHHPSGEYEIIVVDDTSSDDTIAIVRRQYPGVRLFANEKNLGFGKTVNVGLAAAAGAYVHGVAGQLAAADGPPSAADVLHALRPAWRAVVQAPH